MVLLLGEYGEKLVPKEHILKTIFSDIDEQKENKSYHIEKRMTAIELVTSFTTQKETCVIYLASGSLHSPPLALNTVYNLMFRAVNYQTANPENHSVLAINTPFPTDIVRRFLIPELPLTSH